MVDKPPREKMGLLKRAALTSAAFGITGLGIGLKNEADVIKQHEAEPPPSAEVVATDIANAEQRTKDLAAGGAAFGALAALVNAAAAKGIANKKSQPKRKQVQLADRNHVDNERVRWQEHHAEEERKRAEERNR